MKRVFGAILLASISVVPALADVPSWQGMLVVVPGTSPCSYPGVGTQMPAVFRQNFSGADDDPAAFSLYNAFNKSFLFSVSDSSRKFRGSGTLKQRTFNTRAYYYEEASAYSLTTSPSVTSWTQTTPFLDVTLVLRDFDDQTGCRVTLKGGMVRIAP